MTTTQNTQSTSTAKPAPKAKTKKLKDITNEHLSVPGAQPLTLSAATENLQAVVKSDLGRIKVEIRNQGYIGEGYDVVLLLEQVPELLDLLKALDKEANSLIAKQEKK
jgi:hypothetical protein